MKKIAIFIPARNVSRTLPSVLDRIPEGLKKRVKEIFVMDNDSRDNTYMIGIEYKEKSNLQNLKIYRNERDLGYGGVQKKAYNYAINNGFDIVAMLHGDAQYAPELLPAILEPLEKGEADFVFGSRIKGNPMQGGMPAWRYAGNRLLTKVENAVLGLDLSEYHSGFRAFNVQMLKKLPFDRLSDDYHFDTEILIQFALAKTRIAEVPIPTHYGEESGSPTVMQTVAYSLNILRSMLMLLLHKRGIICQDKFDVSPREKQVP